MIGLCVVALVLSAIAVGGVLLCTFSQNKLWTAIEQLQEEVDRHRLACRFREAVDEKRSMDHVRRAGYNPFNDGT